MSKLYKLLFIILFGKEARYMMAMLWAQQIMLGKKTYAQVPSSLKTQVAEILEDSGLPELVTEE